MRAVFRARGEVSLKQVFRFFFSPAIFVNQLQWSTNHAWILVAYLGLTIVESQVGYGRALNAQAAWLLSSHSGIARDQALFLVMVARIAFFFIGALSLAETVWWLGVRLGRSTSKRVLQRRVAVVLAFMLTGYTLMGALGADWQWAVWAVFAWGLMISYLTMREQFALGPVTAALLAVITISSAVLSWQVTDRVAQTAASYAIADQVAKTKAVRPRR